MPKFTPREILKPGLTLKRREEEAGLQEATPEKEPPAPPGMTQAEFFKPPTPEEKAKIKAKLAAFLAKRAP